MDLKVKTSENIIKRADILDIDALASWITYEDIPIQNGIDDFAPTDFEAIKSTLFSLIGPHKSGAVWYSTKKKDDREFITGIFILGLYKPWWSNKVVLNNTLFYVSPNHRSFGFSEKFLKLAMEFSEKANLPFIVNTTVFNEKTETMERYFKIKGFEKVGSTLIFKGGTK